MYKLTRLTEQSTRNSTLSSEQLVWAGKASLGRSPAHCRAEAGETRGGGLVRLGMPHPITSPVTYERNNSQRKM